MSPAHHDPHPWRPPSGPGSLSRGPWGPRLPHGVSPRDAAGAAARCRRPPPVSCAIPDPLFLSDVRAEASACQARGVPAVPGRPLRGPACPPPGGTLKSGGLAPRRVCPRGPWRRSPRGVAEARPWRRRPRPCRQPANAAEVSAAGGGSAGAACAPRKRHLPGPDFPPFHISRCVCQEKVN